MDINEYLICALRCTLKSSLHTINNEIPHWYYGILLEDSGTSSLASLLGLSLDELVNILEICGLLNKNKTGVNSLRTSQSIKSGTYSWIALLNGTQLQTNYLQKMKVKHINDLISAPKKQIWWLGIGNGKMYDPSDYTPSTQFDIF